MSSSSSCYRVEHRTTYRYSEPVTLSHQQLHLTPRPLVYQRNADHEVTITPAPAFRHERTDAFGNPVTEIAIESAHSTLEIRSSKSADEIYPAPTKQLPGRPCAKRWHIAPVGGLTRWLLKPRSFCSNLPMCG